VIEKMDSLLSGITKSAGGDYKFEFNKGYPAVINSENESDLVLKTAKELLGEEKVIELRKPVMAGEDFAFYQKEFPGAFFFVGSASKEADSEYPWHHPKYNVDDKFFETATPLMASLVFA